MKLAAFFLVSLSLLLSVLPAADLVDWNQFKIFGLTGSMFAVFVATLCSSFAILPLYYSYLRPVSKALDDKEQN